MELISGGRKTSAWMGALERYLYGVYRALGALLVALARDCSVRTALVA